MTELLKKANTLPLTPGVYIMRDRSSRVIYVGKSKKLKNRVSQYFQNSEKNIKTAKMVSSVADFDYILCETEIEALTLENALIKQYTPRYNIRLKDAKSYPYIKVTADDYPRITVTRRRDNDRGRYFGPYSGTATAYSVIGTLERTLGLPTCKRQFPRDIGKERPCIYLQMGRCCGLCTGRITPEEYSSMIRCACDILRGNTAAARKKLSDDMTMYAEAEQFEAAARCRDTIRALEALSRKQHVVGAPDSEEDIISLYTDEFCSAITILYVRNGALSDKSEFVFGADEIPDSAGLTALLCEHYRRREYIPKNIYVSFDFDEGDGELLENFLTESSGRKIDVHKPQRGEMKSLCDVAYENAAERAKQYADSAKRDNGALLTLAKMLALETLPERIEAYDISNFGSEHLTAGMIVCENGKFKKSDYRVFNIKTVDGTDDYASMREALGRRLSHLGDGSGSYSELPDLILLDGGRGHVSVVKEMMNAAGYDIPVFGMVKDDYHKTRALCTEDGEINIAKEQSVFMLIYKIQEEVHRFTVSKMEGAKSRTIKHSSLEAIPGIGASKAKRLLAAFGGARGVKEAQVSELSGVSGISAKDAANVYEYFHKEKEQP